MIVGSGTYVESMCNMQVIRHETLQPHLSLVDIGGRVGALGTACYFCASAEETAFSC
jgi:hypothetical protein